MNTPTTHGQLVPTSRPQEPVATSQQYLTFVLGGEMFAIRILNIKEIIEYGRLTTVPMMPSFIRGVINLRGSVVPVIDLAARFGGTASRASRRTCNVIIEVDAAAGRQDVGIVVDSVSEVLEIPQGDIEPPPAFGTNMRVDFFSGMGKVGDGFVILLDLDKVLSVDELAMLVDLSDRDAVTTPFTTPFTTH